MFRTGYAFSRKLILSFLCFLDSKFKRMFNNFISLSLLCPGDTECDPGPKKSTGIFFCHWNLDSISDHDFSKVSCLFDNV